MLGFGGFFVFVFFCIFFPDKTHVYDSVNKEGRKQEDILEAIVVCLFVFLFCF